MTAGFRKPETVRDLVALVTHFRDVLAAHRTLWQGRSSNSDKPSFEFEEQQREIARVLAIIDPYLTRYSAGRFMSHPATGVAWDVYRGAMSAPSPIVKGHSLDQGLLDLEGIISLLGASDPDSPVDLPTPGALRERRVFISHGKDSSALTKVERFLRGLGLTPVIIKFEASRGGSVDDVVERGMAPCECAVILATKDDEVDGRWQPRLNVIHEIGLAQEKLQNRLIYLKEVDCYFPSNISPKIWESFTQDNVEDAYLKIVKELRAFGVIS